MKEWNRQFTLIELLVVVAIMTILAALLLPALSSAKELGRRALCISNLKQLSMMAFVYADTYGGRLMPPVYGDADNGGMSWDEGIASISGRESVIVPVVDCRTHLSERLSSPYRPRDYFYVGGATAAGMPDLAWTGGNPFSRIPSPSTTMLFGELDSARINVQWTSDPAYGKWNWSWLRWDFGEIPVFADSSGAHNGSANWAHSDGSAISLRWSQVRRSMFTVDPGDSD